MYEEENNVNEVEVTDLVPTEETATEAESKNGHSAADIGIGALAGSLLALGGVFLVKKVKEHRAAKPKKPKKAKKGKAKEQAEDVYEEYEDDCDGDCASCEET